MIREVLGNSKGRTRRVHREIFCEKHGKIPLSARVDAKWRGAVWRLPCREVSEKFGRAGCFKGGPVGEWITLMGAVPFPFFYFNEREK